MISLVLFVLLVMSAVFAELGDSHEQWRRIFRDEWEWRWEGSNSAYLTVASACESAAGIIICIVVCVVRGAMRRRDGIPGSAVEDCVCACCCNSSTQCMMFRHEGVGGPNKPYSLCSPVAVAV